MSDYKRLTDEELYDFLSRVFVQLQPTLAQQMMSCAKELLEYRSKLKNGTLVELPCKVSDTVYTVDYDDDQDDWVINEVRVYWFLVDADGAHPMDKIYKLLYEPFYTEVEAEAKLAQIRRQQ